MQFNQLVPLLQGLDSAGITWPAQLRNAAATLSSDSRQIATRALAMTPFDPLTADPDALGRACRERALNNLLRESMGATVMLTLDEVAGALAVGLVDHADEMLDQLRPSFDKAARATHAALRLGIHPGIRAEQVIELVSPSAIKAWRSLPDHAATLDSIARVRLLFSDVLGIAPEPNPFGARQYATAFGSTARWETAQHRFGVQKWLRLSKDRDEPLRLLTVEQTRRLDINSRMGSDSAGVMA